MDVGTSRTGAGAAIVVAIAMAVVTAACTGPNGVSTPPSPTPIPWLEAQPTPSPQRPMPTLPPVPAGTRTCSPADLTASFGYPNGAGGTNFRSIVVANASSSDCALSGTPAVMLRDQSGAVIPTRPGTAQAPPALPVLLLRDDPNACAAPPVAQRVEFRLPEWAAAMSVPTGDDGKVGAASCQGLTVFPIAGAMGALPDPTSPPPVTVPPRLFRST